MNSSNSMNPCDQRSAHRFDKVFPVQVESDTFGACQGIARNISAGGIFIELSDPLPIGSRVRVRFTAPGSRCELVGLGEVKRHYFFQFADETGRRALTGMGVRFTGFDADGEEHLDATLAGYRTLH